MKIQDEMTIREVQETFSNLYPGLKIEFYNKPHEKFDGSQSTDQLDPEVKLGSLHTGKEWRSDDLKLSAQSKVADIEAAFEKNFGLHVQIFRRSKELWLQTSTTDDWSLEKQNLKGIHSTQ